MKSKYENSHIWVLCIYHLWTLSSAWTLEPLQWKSNCYQANKTIIQWFFLSLPGTSTIIYVLLQYVHHEIEYILITVSWLCLLGSPSLQVTFKKARNECVTAKHSIYINGDTKKFFFTVEIKTITLYIGHIFSSDLPSLFFTSFYYQPWGIFNFQKPITWKQLQLHSKTLIKKIKL